MDVPKGPVTFDTPLAPDEVVFEAMSGSEELSRLYLYRVGLLSESPDIRGSQVLGQPLTVHVELPNGQLRHFGGIVTDFRLVACSGEEAHYTATIRPWFWLLTRTSNSRIFQNKSVPDIVKEILRNHGLTDFEERLFGTYPSREYVVQYLESDFNFISRLLEDEGIYYYFQHEASKHVMVLADSVSSHNRIPGCETLPYYPPDRHRDLHEEFVHRWDASEHVRAGKFALTSFDFEKPSTDLSAVTATPREHPFADFELFHFPGNYTERDRGEAIARLRLEEAQADYEVARGATNARAMAVGGLFELKEHPRAEQNREYLVAQTTTELRNPAVRSGKAEATTVHHCDFTVVSSQVPFRPSRISEKPRIVGPQTATVVGKDGAEIWTDEYGRIKLKFHWDRYGKPNESASCWVRVAQTWAGSGWGGIHIPRIGQEVVVDFLNGDPDYPLVTGCVYNKEHMPPYTLPANQTQSGIKSHSSKGGGEDNFNEIRFEDAKGNEELFVQAEKNQTTKVKNDQSLSVGGNRSKSVTGNESITVSGTRTTTVQKKDTVKLNDEHDITVHLKVTQKYENAHDLTVTGLHKGTYDGQRQVTVKTLDKTEVNGGNRETTVHGEYNVTADTHWKLTQGGNTVLVENKIEGKTAGGPITLTNGTTEVKLEGGKIQLTANDEISLACGGASITLKSDGTIELKGSQKVNLGSGASTVALEPTGVNVSGTKVGAHAIGMHEISGAMVKIN